MSYEGYTRHLCEKGHFLQLDCGGMLPPNCQVCNSTWTWMESVNTTNGYNPEDETPLEVAEWITCKECGQTKEIRYKIPKVYWRGKEVDPAVREGFEEIQKQLTQMSRTLDQLEAALSEKQDRKRD